VLLDIQNLTKTYRNGVRANDDVTLAVESGEVYGLLGPNGAGKTTLVSQVLGLVLPDSGTVCIDGNDVVRRPEVARRLCSYQPQAAAPVDGLSPREAVEIVGRIRGGEPRAVRRRAGELLEALDLADVADRVALGSDFPNIPYPYEEQIAAIRSWAAADDRLGDAFVQAVLHDTPARLLGV
jgi:ABC-2 type transport system ATP-binding protein